MNFAACRFCGPLVIAFLLAVRQSRAGAGGMARRAGGAQPARQRRLRVRRRRVHRSPGAAGRHQAQLFPNGWVVTSPMTIPIVTSASASPTPSDGEAHVERIEGCDSVLIRAPSRTPIPSPASPDVTLCSRSRSSAARDYSLSGWMLTLCGGSFSDPNDCPEGCLHGQVAGYRPHRRHGIPPPTVEWVENRRNFVEAGRPHARVGWQNLRTASTAQAVTITVLRINSPFRWHGNHGFIDVEHHAGAHGHHHGHGRVDQPGDAGAANDHRRLAGQPRPRHPADSQRQPPPALRPGVLEQRERRLAAGGKRQGRGTDRSTLLRAVSTSRTSSAPPRAEQPEGNNGRRPTSVIRGWGRERPSSCRPICPDRASPFTATNQIFLPAIARCAPADFGRPDLAGLCRAPESLVESGDDPGQGSNSRDRRQPGGCSYATMPPLNGAAGGRTMCCSSP